jgi:hypothetical protein
MVWKERFMAEASTSSFRLPAGPLEYVEESAN